MNIVFFKNYYKPFEKDFNKIEIKFASTLIKSEFPVDRVDKNNLYKIKLDKIPKEHFTKMSFEECCMERAEQLWNLNKPINLFWSGGIDSTSAAIALLETKREENILKIRCTKESIEEFPEFFEKIKNYCDIFDKKNFLNREIFSNHNEIKITGECGDQLFGTESLFHKQDSINKPWTELFKWDKNYLFPGYNYSDNFYEKNKNSFFNFLFEHVDYCPFEIKTIFDLYWWLGFTLRWVDVDTRMTFIYTKTTEWKSTLSFFNTENFQRWSITNHDIKQKKSWEASYKQPAKDYINKYFPNENYRKNKLKIGSLIHILNDNMFERTNKNDKKAIKLCLDNGQYWLRDDLIDQEILNKLLL